MLKIHSYTFQAYIDMCLILSEALGTGATAVRLYAERYSQYRLLNPYTLHGIDFHMREMSTVCPSPVNCGR
jgi:hypothetical protein